MKNIKHYKIILKPQRARRALEENWLEITPNWFVRTKFNPDVRWHKQCGHKCEDGKIRAIEKYGTLDKYTRCWKCKTKVHDLVRAYFNMRQLAVK